MIDGGLNELLLETYACPANVDHWPKVLDGIRERLRVRCAALQILSNVAPRVRVSWVARDSESKANQDHYDPFISGDENPRLRAGPPRSRTAKMFMRDRDFFQAGDPDLGRLHQRLADLGLGCCLSAGIRLSAHESLVLVLHRDLNDRDDFSHDDEMLIATIMPHLRQSVSLTGELQLTRQHSLGLRQAADRLSMGLVLCDADARPSWVNQAARRIFAERNRIWISQGLLTSTFPGDTSELRRAIAQAAHASDCSWPSTQRCLPLNQSRSGTALQILVVPLDRDSGADVYTGKSVVCSNRVLLMFSDAASPPVLSPDLIAALFALSPAESRLTTALCQGRTVSEYAASHGVSVGTARFQLKQVLAKTRSPRQSELVRRVCTSVVAHAMQSDP